MFGTGQLPKFGMDLFHTQPATEEGQGLLDPNSRGAINEYGTHYTSDAIAIGKHGAYALLPAVLSYGRDTRGLIQTPPRGELAQP